MSTAGEDTDTHKDSELEITAKILQQLTLWLEDPPTPLNLGALQLIFMCSKDSVGTGYSTQLQAKLKQEQIDKHHCFSQHMHLYGQGICIGYSKCCQSGSYYSKE